MPHRTHSLTSFASVLKGHLLSEAFPDHLFKPQPLPRTPKFLLIFVHSTYHHLQYNLFSFLILFGDGLPSRM